MNFKKWTSKTYFKHELPNMNFKNELQKMNFKKWTSKHELQKMNFKKWTSKHELQRMNHFNTTNSKHELQKWSSKVNFKNMELRPAFGSLPNFENLLIGLWFLCQVLWSWCGSAVRCGAQLWSPSFTSTTPSLIFTASATPKGREEKKTRPSPLWEPRDGG